MAFPQITIKRPQLRFWQWVALRMWPAWFCVAALAGVGFERHSSAMVYGALIAAGTAIVIAAIEGPLILRAVARHQRKVIQSWSLPPGTLFAALGSQVGYLAGAASGPAESRAGLRRGLLTLNGDGVQFRGSASRSEPWDTTLAWPEIARIDARPGGSPLSVRVSVVTPDGKTVTWRTNGMGNLSAALDQLHQDRTCLEVCGNFDGEMASGRREHTGPGGLYHRNPPPSRAMAGNGRSKLPFGMIRGR